MKFILAFVVAACAAVSAHAAPNDSIAFVKLPAEGPVSIPYRAAKAGTLVVDQTAGQVTSFKLDAPTPCSAQAVSASNPNMFATFNVLQAAGTIPLYGDKDAVFMKFGSGGSEATLVVLALLNPARCSVVGMAVNVPAQATEMPSLTTTDNYNAPAFAAEKKFLESIRGEYGYFSVEDLSANPSDPRFAYVFWKKDNPEMEGRMKLRRFKGDTVFKATVQSSVTRGSVTYSAYFKGGVVAYDKTAGSHYVLFHPEDASSWPSVLVLNGNYLFIGTHGEGVYAVNLKTFALGSVEVPEDYMTVDALSVKGGRLIVNKKFKAPLPSF